MQIGLRQLIKPELELLVNNRNDSKIVRKSAVKHAEAPDLSTIAGLQKAREARKLSAEPASRPIAESFVSVEDRKIPVRIARPQNAVSTGVFFNIPGGGFYLDESARADAQNLRLADSLGMTIISVTYRLAPENPYPAAPDDCTAVAHWLIKESAQLFGTDRLFIGGSSAGATLAISSLFRLRENDLASRFMGTVLQFGAYDLSGQTPGGRLYSDEYFIRAYAGHIPDLTNPGISPLFGDFKDLPPTLILVGTEDILMEDSFAIAARLSAAGNDIDLRVYPAAKHGFTAGLTKMARAANQDIAEWIKRR